MPKKITHGQVCRATDHNVRPSYAIAVESLEFPTIASTATPPAGTAGTLILKDTPRSPRASGTPPYDPYDRDEVIVYEDGNNHNTTYMVVTNRDGPIKYRIAVR